MTFSESFDIRFSEMEDLPFLEKWFSDPSSCWEYPFDFTERGDALKNWIGFSKFKASLTGLLENQPCAIATLFLMPYRKVAHQCSFYLIVAPEYRRQGIGTSMVRNILHLAKTRFGLESVYVEIYESSSFLPLLEKLGFHLFVRQDNYVKIEGCSRARLLLEHPLDG
jgi:RimJ/RimL family protein N-acetyltransferase